MVDAITGFVVNKIGDYLFQEAALFHGVKDDLEELKAELAIIQGYLKDAEARQDEDNALKEWIKLVRDIAYDIEDVLDSYHLQVEERQEYGGGCVGRIKKWCCGIRVKSNTYNIAKEIESLKKRMFEISRLRETYCIRNTNDSQGSLSSRLRQIRRTALVVQEERTVGLEDDANILFEKLLGEEPGSYMISIFGMGGLGKTALARKLYNSHDVKTRFQYRGWTYVSQESETRDLLLRIIESFGGIDEESRLRIERKSVESLEVYLRNYLQGKRYLVVIDDVWRKEAWESLKRAFPRNENGSKVIMTTCIKDVAEGADERVYAHNLRFLTFEESWKLFQEKAFRDYQGVDEDLEELGKEMVLKCDGLPLAIIVLAGILSRKRPNEWQMVRDHLWQQLKNDSIHISSVLTLSFDNLHHELKLCFLYLSIFPEDHEIDVEDLIRLLVAEGFIQEDEEMMEDTANRYIEELIDRSLIQAERRNRGRICNCRVHDLIRDLTVKKAKELNFMHVHDGQVPHSLILTCRRNAIHCSVYGDIHLESLNKKMRTLLYVGNYPSDETSFRFLSHIKLIRVLRLGETGYYHFPFSREIGDAIGELIHLRYLKISGRNLVYLLEYMSKCRHLQTLILINRVSLWKQIDLCMLRSLRHLIGPFKGRLLISDAANLQTLCSVTSRAWKEINQEKLINLRELEISDSFTPVAGCVCLDMGSFSKLRNLRFLYLYLDRFNFSSPDQLPAFQNLVELRLEVALITALPKDMEKFFPNLEALSLDTSNLEEDPMPAVEKLPRLEIFCLKAESHSKQKMVFSAQGFRHLRSLILAIPNTEELQIADDAMPSLMRWEDEGGVLKLMIPEWLLAIRQEVP